MIALPRAATVAIVSLVVLSSVTSVVVVPTTAAGSGAIEPTTTANAAASVTATACTPISGPTVIDSPGCYVLTADSGDAVGEESGYIEIESDDVILDGGGHTIDVADPFGNETAPYVGVLVDGPGTDDDSISNLTIRDLDIRTDEHGISLYDTADVLLENVSVSRFEDYGILVDYSTRVVVRDSVAYGDPSRFPADGFHVDESSHVSLVNDTVVGNGSVDGFRVADSSNVTLLNDTVLNGDSAFSVVGSDNVVLRDNVARGNADTGFLVNGVNVTLTGNLAESNGDRGIDVDIVGGDIRDNVVVDNGDPVRVGARHTNTDSGIVADGEDYRLYNNTASGSDIGVVIHGSDANVTGNRITDNTVGVVVRPNTYQGYAVVTGNRIAHNERYGIRLDADDVRIASNTIVDNGRTGLYVVEGTGNLLYHNTFNNTDNVGFAQPSLAPNAWNVNRTCGADAIGGSYQGGNLWATPGGNGFSQRWADDDHDGRVDISHRLVDSNVDYQPLIRFSNPVACVSPRRVEFGPVDIGTNLSAEVSISNIGSTDFDVTNLTIVGDDADQFAIASGELPKTVPPDETRTLVVEFVPTAVGRANASLVIETDDPGTPTATVALVGNGTAAPVPDIEVSPAAYDFGNVTVGDAASTTITVANNGSANLTVRNVTLSGSNASAFAVVRDNATGILEPGENSAVTVAFSPGSVGPKSAALVVESDDLDSPTTLVSLAGNGTAAPVPAIEVSPAAYDFGDVTVGDTASTTVTVANNGSANLTVRNVTLAGANASAFVVTGGSSFVLVPDENRSLSVSFAPATVGSKSGTLVVESDDPITPNVTVALAGNATPRPTPDIEVTPAALDFGDVTVGDSASLPLTIRNVGTANLTVSALNRTGSDSFTVTAGSVPVELSPGDTHNLTVSFAPSSTGPATGALAIESDDPDQSVVTVSLVGNGTERPTPNIEVSPPSYDFGAVRVGSTTTTEVTIENAGLADLHVRDLRLSGVDAGAFGVSNDSPITLVPGENRTIAVTFAPGTNGTKSATLVVESDDPDEPTASVNLTGLGVEPEIVVSPTRYDFGDVVVGSSASTSVTVANNGTANLTVSAVTLSGPNSSAFSVAAGAPFTLGPGESTDLSVSFEPSGPGNASAVLGIESNDTDEPVIEVALEGRGVSAGLVPGEDFDAEFKGCSEVWVVFHDEGQLPVDATVRVYNENAGTEETVDVEITGTDVERVPGQYGDRPLYKFNVHDHFGRDDDGDDKVLAVAVGGGPITENTNRCADAAGERDDDRNRDDEDADDRDRGDADDRDDHEEDDDGDDDRDRDAPDDDDDREGRDDERDDDGDDERDDDEGDERDDDEDDERDDDEDDERDDDEGDERDDGRDTLGPIGFSDGWFGGGTDRLRFFAVSMPSRALVPDGSGAIADASTRSALTATNATPVTGCRVIDAPGRYRLDASVEDSPASTCIEIRSSDVILDGAGHRLDGTDATDSTGVVVNGSGITNVTVTRLSLTDWGRGIRIAGASAVTVSAFEATSNGIGVLTQHVHGATVTDGYLRDNDQHGIAARDTTNLTVEANRLFENDATAVDLEASNESAIVGNVLGRDRGPDSGVGGIRVGCWGCSDVVVADNHVYQSTGRGIQMRGDHHTIVDNEVRHISRPTYGGAFSANGIDVAGDAITIRNNTVENAYAAIYIVADEPRRDVANDTLVANNTLVSTTLGLWGLDLRRGLIEGNVVVDEVEGRRLGTAFDLWNTNGTVLRDNDVRGRADVDATGIVLRGSSGNRLVANTLDDLGGYGIYVTGGTRGATDNTLADNAVSDVGVVGISLHTDGSGTATPDTWDYVESTTLDNNTVSGSPMGIEFASTRHNTMRDNTLAGNGLNFYIRQVNYPTLDEFSRSHPPLTQMSRVEHFVHDIDASNTVDGRPIRYVVGGSGTTINASSTAGFVAVVNGDGATVTDLTLRNNSHGVLLVNSTDSLVENVSVAHVTHGVEVLEGSDGSDVVGSRFDLVAESFNPILGIREESVAVFVGESSGVRVLESDFHLDTLRTGIGARFGSDDVVVSRNAISVEGHPNDDTRAMALDGLRGAEVRANDVRDAPVEIRNVTDATLADNRLADGASITVRDDFGAPSSRLSIRNNTLRYGLADFETAVRFFGSTAVDATVANNTVVNSSTAFEIGSSSGVTLVGNSITGASIGVELHAARNVSVTRNDLVRTRRGISLSGADSGTEGNLVRDNVLLETAFVGISLRSNPFDPLRNNTVVGNHVSATGTAQPYDRNALGIELEGPATADNTISNNTVIDTDGDGLHFDVDTANNSLVDNVVANTTGWDLYAERDAVPNVTRLRLDTGTVTVEGRNVGIDAYEAPGGSPTNYRGLNSSLRVVSTNRSYDRPAWLDLGFHYTDADVTGVNESTLRVWRYVGGTPGWDRAADTAVDTSANRVEATITRIDAPVYAPLGLEANATNATPQFPTFRAGSAWPEYGHDAAGTSYQPLGPGPAANVTLNWSVAPGGSVPWYVDNGGGTAPLAVANGTVYAATWQTLTAFEATTGRIEWTVGFEHTDYDFRTAPAVGDDIVYVVGRYKTAYVVEAIDVRTGFVLWSNRYSTGDIYLDVYPLKVENDTLYLAAEPYDGDVHLHALHTRTGAERWTANLGTNRIRGPIVADGAVVVSRGAGTAGDTAVLDAADGSTVATLPDVASDLAYADGRLVVSTGAAVAAYDLASVTNGTSANGTPTPLWRVGADAHGGLYDLAVANGAVFVGRAGGNVTAFDARTGSPLWNHTDPRVSGGTSELALAGGHLYYSPLGGPTIAALDAATGAEAWRYTAPHPVSAPVVAACTLFVGSDLDVSPAATRVFALRGEERCGPEAVVTPTSLSFGTIEAGTTASASVVVSNGGADRLAVGGPSIVGDNASAFALADDEPFVLAPGASRQLAVEFAPATPGPKTATLRIETDDPNASVVNVSLSGSRERAVQVVVTPANGTVEPGESVTVRVTADTEELPVYAVQATLRFDATRLEVNDSSGVEPGDLLSADGNATLVVAAAADDANGTVAYAETRTGPRPISGNGTLFRVTFDVRPGAPDGDAAIALGDVVAVDANATAVSNVTHDGTTTVAAGSGTSPSLAAPPPRPAATEVSP